MTKFIEEKMVSIKNDLDKIRTKPLMYISYVGRKGALHLSKEVINNGIDECVNPNSPGDTMWVTLDDRYNRLTTEDNGRGFPFAGMLEACTVNHSSTKFTRSVGGESAGENGIGITATNALSKEFTIDVYKLGERAKLAFIDGDLVEKPNVVKTDKVKKHGSIVTFIPDEKYMGECKIEHVELFKWLSDIKHLLPQGIVIHYTHINEEGKKEKFKLYNSKGLYDMVKELEPKLLCDPVHLLDKVKFKEKVRNIETGKVEELDRFLGIEFGFSYKKSESGKVVDEPVIKSLCNFIHTIDNGTHADAVRNTIAQFLVKCTKEIMSQKELEKYDVTSADATSGLVLCVNLTTNTNPGFTNQTKEKIHKPEIYRMIADLTRLSLTDYFKTNPKELKKLCDYVKTNAKSRYEATKAKNAVVKRDRNPLSEYGIKGYVPANNKAKGAYREIFLIEGESVEGNADKARDKEVQALFSFRGVPYNSFRKAVHEVLDNAEFHNLVAAMRCQLGARFKLEDLQFEKIIIMTDADVDGNFITSLICAFFAYHLPGVVEAGRLYKAMPPLYKIDDKKKPFILDKMQFVEVFERRIGDNVQLLDLNDKVIKDSEFKKFLYNNRTYLEELMRVANHFAVHPMLIEFVLIHMDEKDFGKKLSKRFPEIILENSSEDKNARVVSGVVEGKYQLLFIDKLMMKKCSKMLKIIHEVNNANYYKVLEKTGKNIYDDLGVMTIGEFFMRVQKYQPKIEMRYKGLGELSSVDLEKTTLDPNNRMLVRLTMKDLEEEIAKFDILHGKAEEEKKAMMKAFKIDREFLDN